MTEEKKLLHELGGILLNAAIITSYFFMGSIFTGGGIPTKALLISAGFMALHKGLAYLMKERNLNGV